MDSRNGMNGLLVNRQTYIKNAEYASASAPLRGKGGQAIVDTSALVVTYGVLKRFQQ